MWPDRTFAANLSPNETLRDRYDINSINTNKGNKAKGQPAGTNNEKNSVPCLLNPKIVAPKTIVKLKENVNIKWQVYAKLQGPILTKLFTNIKINKLYIKGK